LYTDGIEKLQPKEASPLLKLAKQYDIKVVTEVVANFIQNGLNAANALLFFSDPNLDAKDAPRILRYIQANAPIVFKDKAFNDLPKEKLISILKSQQMNISETELFKAVVGWARAQQTKQILSSGGVEIMQGFQEEGQRLRQILTDVLPHIRFGIMSMGALAEIVKPTGILTPEELINLFTYLSGDKRIVKCMFPTRPRDHFLDSFGPELPPDFPVVDDEKFVGDYVDIKDGDYEHKKSDRAERSPDKNKKAKKVDQTARRRRSQTLASLCVCAQPTA
jgi:hypothetical protein